MRQTTVMGPRILASWGPCGMTGGEGLCGDDTMVLRGRKF